MKSVSRLALLAAAGVATTAAVPLVANTAAQADTFFLTSCHISGSTCQGGSIPAPGFGNVVLNQVGTSVTFDVTLINGNTFIETGSGGKVLFLFDDSIAGSSITNITATNNGATVAIPGGLSGFTNISPAVMADGTGHWTATVGCTLTDNTCNPGMIPTINDLHFTVTNATIAQLTSVGNDNGNIFAADILCGSGQTQCNGLTGPVDTPVPGPILGAGLPGLVMACAGLVGLARRRRQKIA
jgi:hypothetical protein